MDNEAVEINFFQNIKQRLYRYFSKNLFTAPKVIIMCFFTVIVFGAALLRFDFASSSGKSISFIDALFTSTSAVCVTGLIVKDTPNDFTTFGQIVILSLIQIGGLGVMTLYSFVAISVKKKISLTSQQFISSDRNVSRLDNLRVLIYYVVFTTFIFEAIGAFFLFFTFIGMYSFKKALYFSIFHSISAFCNAGFALFSNSFETFSNSPVLLYTIMFLIIVGGIGFIKIIELFEIIKNELFIPLLFKFTSHVRPEHKKPLNKKREVIELINKVNFDYTDDTNIDNYVRTDYKKTSIKEILRNFKRNLFLNSSLETKIVLLSTVILITLGALSFYIFENNNLLKGKGFFEKVNVSLFQSITCRTAGFNVSKMDELSTASKFMSTMLMFIGASPGSTGGGIKTTTIFIIFLAIIAIIKMDEDVTIFKVKIRWSVIKKALAIFFIVLIMNSMIVLAISHIENFRFMDVMFEVVSASSTTGLSLGITGSLSTASKYLLVMAMFIGRVGIFTFAFALTETLKKYSISYPEDDLVVG